MNLATFLATAREKNQFSLRQLQEKAANLDHAYISRLENGDRDQPSEDTIEKLAKALKLNRRDRQIFELLAETDIDDLLYNIMVSRLDYSWSHLEPVATMSFRGQRPKTEDDWLKMINLVKDL